MVVQPICLDEQPKGVNPDKGDAQQLALRPDCYVAGNAHTLATGRVPPPAEEQKQIESPHGEWTTLDLYALGRQSVHMVNDH